MPKIKTTREWKNFSRRAVLKDSQHIRRAVQKTWEIAWEVGN